MNTKHDLSLGLILLAGFGLIGGKAARGQAMQQGRDGNGAPCVLSLVNAGVLMSQPGQGCSEYHDYKPDIVPNGKVTIALHKPPSQTWQPPPDTSFATTVHFLVKNEKDCATAFSLADKGNGKPAEYICENRKDHKPYAELQCDGDKERQNCYGLRYENGTALHKDLHIVASLQ